MKKKILAVIVTAMISILSILLTALQSCTTLLVTQKNPKESNQKIEIQTSVDSTKLVLQPALNFK